MTIASQTYTFTHGNAFSIDRLVAGMQRLFTSRQVRRAPDLTSARPQSLSHAEQIRFYAAEQMDCDPDLARDLFARANEVDCRGA